MHRPSADGVNEDAAAAANGFLLVILGAARLSTRWPVHHSVGGTAGTTETDTIIKHNINATDEEDGLIIIKSTNNSVQKRGILF